MTSVAKRSWPERSVSVSDTGCCCSLPPLHCGEGGGGGATIIDHLWCFLRPLTNPYPRTRAALEEFFLPFQGGRPGGGWGRPALDPIPTLVLPLKGRESSC